MKFAYFLLVVAVTIFLKVQAVSAQTTQFSYQGNLTSGGAPANGNYDIEFRLFDVLSGGVQISVVQRTNVPVTNGVFSVSLSFGSGPMNGTDRFIEVATRPAGGGSFTTLSPRTQILSAPYAIKSLSANTAVSAEQLNGTPAANFIQSGATSINAGTQFNINSIRVIATPNVENTFVGMNAGAPSGSAGTGNTALGAGAGQAINSGFTNATYIGRGSGTLNVGGSDNTLLGAGTQVQFSSLSHATAIGAGATVGSNNTIVLGRTTDRVEIPGQRLDVGPDDASGNTAIHPSYSQFFRFGNSPYAIVGLRSRGTRTAPLPVLSGDVLFQIEGLGWNGSSYNPFGSEIRFIANEDFTSTAAGGRIDFRMILPGTVNNIRDIMTLAYRGVGITNDAPTEKLDIADNGSNILFGGGGCPSGSVAIGLSGPFANCTNYSIRGNDVALFLNRPVGGEVVFREGNGTTQFRIRPGGVVQVAVLGTAGSTSLCRNASGDIATCSSSARYKNNIASFAGGLDLVRKLNPVSFNWREGGMADLGLVAEDVAAIEPLLTTTNDKGEIEGVKYDRIGVVLINAVKEQQAEIERLRSKVAELEVIKTALCARDPKLAFCTADK